MAEESAEHTSLCSRPDEREAAAFYDSRYDNGYMETWPEQKKQRIVQIIRSLPFPETGRALDFGCGNGVLTEVLRRALPPHWTVYGTDVSTKAIENARRWHPGCQFFATGQGESLGNDFDFLFTHHVLEHVSNIHEVLDRMAACVKQTSTMLHILPCANEDSFEHRLCRLHRDGFKPGGIFFFEDPGHLRRLSTDQLSTLYAERGFQLVMENYSNQYHGAFNWITQTRSPGFIGWLTAGRSARDPHAAKELRALRCKLLFYWALRNPAVRFHESIAKKRKLRKDYLALAKWAALYFIAKPMDSYLNRKSESEWTRRKGERNGSEMYLLFERSGQQSAGRI